MLLGEVVDELLDEHRLADARAAEQADLAALCVGGEQVDDLDPRLEHLGGRAEILRSRGVLVDSAPFHTLGQRSAFVDGLAEQVEDAPERDLADGDHDRPTRVDHLGAAGESVGRVHRDSAHAVIAEVLLDLAHEHALAGARADPRLLLLGCGPGPGDDDRVIDFGQALGEHGLDHDALDLLDAADVALLGGCARALRLAGRLGGG